MHCSWDMNSAIRHMNSSQSSNNNFFIIFFRDNYSKPPWGLARLRFAYLWFKTYHFTHLRCLPLEICYPPLPLPLGKHIFREKKNNKDQKVRVFYCLRTSFRTKHKNSTQIKCSIKSLLIYININNLITTKNWEPIFTRRPTISKQSATLLTKESEIEISNQQPKNEVMRNLAVGLDCGRSAMGLVAWWRP